MYPAAFENDFEMRDTNGPDLPQIEPLINALKCFKMTCLLTKSCRFESAVVFHFSRKTIKEHFHISVLFLPLFIATMFFNMLTLNQKELYSIYALKVIIMIQAHINNCLYMVTRHTSALHLKRN